MSEVWCPDGASSRAVLLGTAAYRSDELPEIPAVDSNLSSLRRTLTDSRRGLLSDRHCRVLGYRKQKSVSVAAVGAALADAAREATDLLLVYYAGHGLLDHRGRLHLALTDTDPDPGAVGFSAVQVEPLLDLMGRARARARVLIVDCCYSGRLVPAMATDQGIIRDQFRRSGTYTLTSTTKNELSFAPPEQQHTAFTAALLRALEGPHALTLDEIYSFVHDDLTGRSLPPPQRCAVNAANNLTLLRGPARTRAQHPTDTADEAPAPGKRGVRRSTPATGEAVFVQPLTHPAKQRMMRGIGAVLLLALVPIEYGLCLLTAPPIIPLTAPFLLIVGGVLTLSDTEVRRVLTVNATGLGISVEPPSPGRSTHIPWTDILDIGWVNKIECVHSNTTSDNVLVRLRPDAAPPGWLTEWKDGAPADGGTYYRLGTLADFGASVGALRDALLRYCPDDYHNDRGPARGSLKGMQPLII
ncbi:caspase family protein [Streptomyces noursei]|uniref:caspase family protein n=1 Tax=Streptomyces noursei TaxID=1971 RepID=UPI0023B82606|nr:caspase family protein [Streptomyces noursei]